MEASESLRLWHIFHDSSNWLAVRQPPTSPRGQSPRCQGPTHEPCLPCSVCQQGRSQCRQDQPVLASQTPYPLRGLTYHPGPGASLRSQKPQPASSVKSKSMYSVQTVCLIEPRESPHNPSCYVGLYR